MAPIDRERIEREAREEIEQETHRALVDRAKERIRAYQSRSLWQRLFPWRIVSVRTDEK